MELPDLCRAALEPSEWATTRWRRLVKALLRIGRLRKIWHNLGEFLKIYKHLR